MQEESIKTIVPVECSKCKENLFVEFRMVPPAVTSVFTVGDVKNAKDDLKLRVEVLSIDESKKKEVIEWADKEETIFGPSEVESIIQGLLK